MSSISKNMSKRPDWNPRNLTDIGPDLLHMSNVYMRRSRLARLPPIRQYTYAFHGFVLRLHSRRTKTAFEKKGAISRERATREGTPRTQEWVATRAESRRCLTRLSTMYIEAANASTSRNTTAIPSPITSNERYTHRKSKISHRF